ncbi:DUF6301 family protein [Microbacterium sp. AGC85]
MTWKVMPPAEVCDVMDFLIALEWPLPEAKVQSLASERFGWTIETEDGQDYLMNTVTGLSIPDVTTIDPRGAMYVLRFRVTDVTPPPTPESTAFLGDEFALLVREGTSRWGKPEMSGGDARTSASWDVPGAARVRFNLAERSVSASFSTPQGVESDLKAARSGV